MRAIFSNNKVRFARSRIAAVAAAAVTLLASCFQPIQGSGELSAASRAAAAPLTLTGPNGTLQVSGMTGTSLTVSYTPASPVSQARIYLSPGDAPGLVVASQPMANSGGSWTFTYSHPSYVDGAKIYVDVLASTPTGEVNVPQGILGDSTTWASFTYGGSSEGALVTFDSAGATVSAVPSSILVSPAGGTVSQLPSAPSRLGYSFLGWYTAPNGGGTRFTETTAVNESLTVYAAWRLNSSGGLTLTGPNGTVSVSAMTGSSLTVSYTPAAPVDQARLFLSEGNGIGLVLASQGMANNGGTWTYTFSHPTYVQGAKIYLDVLTLRSGIETNVPQGILSNTASWASFEYGALPDFATVTFDSSSADTPATPASMSVASEGDSLGSLPSEPVKALADFGGWFTAPNGEGDSFTAETPVYGDITVYAYWIGVETATVSFDSNGATVPASPSSMTVEAGASLGNLPENPRRTGYTFSGWNLSRDGSGAAFTAATPVVSNLTVYAQWTEYTGPELLPLAPGMHMTMQFANRTSGAWDDSEIFLTMLARNEAQDWCWVKPDGTLQPMSLADNGQLAKNGRLCANYSFRLSDMEGFQLPPYVSSGRVFVTMGEPLYITVNIDGNGRVAYAAPDLNNATDPNGDVFFDWYEFAIVPATWAAGSPVGFWGNTTQVDQLSVPLLARVYEKDGAGGATYLGENGISESRAELWDAWQREVPAEFQGLINEYRINAPCKDPDGFGLNAPHASYYDAYVNQIWNQYRAQDLVFNMYWDGNTYEYRGRVYGDAFVFSRAGRTNFTAVARKPNATEIFEASGVLATGNTEEGAIQARIAAAFNRHVMEDSGKWDDPSSFYQAAPCNYYSKFMHDHAVNGKAYGFAYDDVGDFSGALWSYNGRAVVIDVNW